ncbi:MAG: HAD family hydrolase [Propionibacteriaceae bacterium]|nr:HAD family hydrolase [Propionibacteriaceae bacterium]
MLERPVALLLDFGGVVIETRKRLTGPSDVAVQLQQLLAKGGYRLSRDELADSVEAGSVALKHWKHASSRRQQPTELTHREVVSDFLAADLPEGPRALLSAEATTVLEVISAGLNDHPIRPGIREILELCRAEGIRVGIVSNAHSGTSHRRILDDLGIAEYFGVQVYSDEVGIRKPNPDMIRIAAEALGTIPEHCWYVGDTQDRDVVAGRRADVGGVLITRSKHTDNPPFPVRDKADAMFDDPRGLLAELRRAVAQPGSLAERSRRQPALPLGPALLIDHGGVISLTAPGTDGLARFLEELRGQLERTGIPAPTTGELGEALANARQTLKERKAERLAAYEAQGGELREVTHQEFWQTVAAHLQQDFRAWFRAEADDLAARYGNVKSDRQCRPGMPELLRRFAQAGTPVVVVSNTVSGRAVRDSCKRYGLDPYIAAYVASDEHGLRKPEPDIFREALTIASADPARTIFIGDKPRNDAAGARAVGIAHRILLTGGSTPDDELHSALADGTATQVVSDVTDLLPLREAIAS